MRVHINERQIEWLESRISNKVNGFKSSFVFILLAFFLLLLDPSLKNYAIILFAVGAVRLLYK